TFSQEGWHYKLETPDAPVTIKGIVYNEMKGVFSDFRSHVSRKTISYLFPDTTYYYESGGEPEHITELTYKQFKEFHEQFYHPSNSLIIIYGNIPSEKTLDHLQENFLSHFSYRTVDSIIKTQPRWDKPRVVQFSAPSSQEDDGTSSVLVSWMFSSSTDPVDALIGRIFSHYFFGNESSPLRRALVDCKLGEDLDDMCGFDCDLSHGMFCAGLRKANPENAEKIKKLIFDTISNEINKKIDSELLEGSIRQIEFRLREITNNSHFPYNLILAERVLRSWIYDGDPLNHLCFEKTLNLIKKKKSEGTDFFIEKMQKLLLNNNHNILSIVEASSEMGKQLGKKSEMQAAQLSSNFSKEDRNQYYEFSQKLQKAQKEPVSKEALNSLPKLKLSDLPLENEKTPTNIRTVDGITVYTHPLFTAGIIYLDIGFDLSGISQDLLSYFPLYSELLTRCGAAGKNSEQMAKRIALQTGGINCSDFCSTLYGNEDDIIFRSFFHGKCLPERFSELIDIFNDLFTNPDLENHKLIHDILLEMRNEISASLIRNGHQYAAAYSAARLSKSGYIDEILDGVFQLRFLDRELKSENLDSIVLKMKLLHKIIINKTNLIISMTCGDPDKYVPILKPLLRNLPQNTISPADIEYNTTVSDVPLGIEINSSVNFIAQSWKINKNTPGHIGQFYLLSRYLSTDYLWDKVRVEGGAYGGMANVSGTHPIMSCLSYRDPNIQYTLNSFKNGFHHVTSQISRKELTQSIIGTIGNIDQPRAPHNKGFGETLALLCNRTPQIRQEIRTEILNCTSDLLKEKAHQILDTYENTAITVFGNTQAFDNFEKEGFGINREPLLKKDSDI
ncbi:MAG: insulinase family protein, partial [Chitinispirillia bacterium]